MIIWLDVFVKGTNLHLFVKVTFQNASKTHRNGSGEPPVAATRREAVATSDGPKTPLEPSLFT